MEPIFTSAGSAFHQLLSSELSGGELRSPSQGEPTNNMGALDEIYHFGVNIIASLQNTYPDSEDFFDVVTKSFDPLYAFSVIFPVLVGIHIHLATDILVVSVVAEWMNTVLKWLFREDRPFWWVRETGLYNVTGTFRPILKQTPLTCETGPGSPSGHVMGAAAVGYVLVQTLNHFVVSREKISEPAKKLFAAVMWGAFFCLMILVAVSRMYVSTHFPHQCLLGLFCGIMVSWSLTSPSSPLTEKWRTSSRPTLLLVALGMMLFTVACYWLQRLLGLDPQWSVKLAFKWCENPEWLHVNTTPLFCLVRDCGVFFGLALAAPLRKGKLRDSAIAEIMTSIGLAFAFHLAGSTIPTGNVYVYYGCQFMLQSVQTYLYLVFIPKIGNIVKWKRD